MTNNGGTVDRRPVVLGPGEGRAYLMGPITDATIGSFVVVPGGVTHTFENRGAERAGFLSVVAPGGFEDEMPGIAAWWAENPPGDTRD